MIINLVFFKLLKICNQNQNFLCFIELNFIKHI